MRDLYKILVIASSYIYFTFPIQIVTNNYIAYAVIDTVSNNTFGGYAHCVVYSGIAFPQIAGLLGCKAFDFLLVLDTLKPCVFFVVQSVVRFDLFSIDYKRCPLACYTCRQVIKSKVNT